MPRRPAGPTFQSRPGSGSPPANRHRGGDDLSRGVAALTRYVQRTVRSAHEARAYLQRLGYPSDVVTRAVELCAARGELDDGACARLWAGHWARRGDAWALIRERLLAKGLGEPAVAEAARAVGAEGSDAERARAWLRRKAAARGAGARDRARVARRLRARGFGTELIESLLDDTITHADDER